MGARVGSASTLTSLVGDAGHRRAAVWVARRRLTRSISVQPECSGRNKGGSTWNLPHASGFRGVFRSHRRGFARGNGFRISAFDLAVLRLPLPLVAGDGQERPAADEDAEGDEEGEGHKPNERIAGAHPVYRQLGWVD